MFEKKNGKRFLASAMALVMLLSLAPVSALAAPGEGPGGWPGESRPGGSDAGTSKSTDVYVYAKVVTTEGTTMTPSKDATGERKQLTINGKTLTINRNNGAVEAADEGVWATLGKISTTAQLDMSRSYTDQNSEPLQTVVSETAKQLEETDNRHADNKDVADEFFASITEFDLHTYKGGNNGDAADGYDVSGTCWHLDGTITVYKVTYNNGAPEGATVDNMPTDDDGYYLNGTKYSISGQEPTREGYTFDGWEFDGTPYNPGDTLTISSKDVVLTARWTENSTEPTVPEPEPEPEPTPEPDVMVTAKYYINLGGKDASNPYGGGTFTEGIEIENAINETVFNNNKRTDITSNNGYIFNIDGVETDYANLLNSEPTAEQVNNKLPEQYKPTMSIGGTKNREVVWYHVSSCHDGYHVDGYIKNVEITITYNPAGGKFADGTTDNKTERDLSGQAHTIIADIPTKSGYVFAGWKVEGDSSDKIYKDGDSITPMSDLTLVAQWEVDNWKDADETADPDDVDSDEGGDGTPDRYQVTIKYVADSTGRGTVGTLTEEVKTIYKEGKWATSGTVTASGSVAEATGSRCYFSNWTNDADVDTSKAGAELGKQTIENAKGGETYTFTANFGKRSSSGGNSRPSDSIVDIPDDDVPTGLNGADHYAYIIGYGNNDVRPQQSITRAEVATIFFRLLTDETREANMTKNQNYSDVKDSDWYCRAVATLSSMGIIKGYNDGTFQPNAPITRAEFAAIAARFDPDGDTTPATFSDVGSHWAKDEISIAANHGWINGYEDGTFKPDRNITRAEAVTLINRVLNRLPETKEDLHEDMKTWVDNMDETAWYYLAIQEATNSHYNTNKEGTKYETWTDLRESRDWSELEK